jgi:hypothetical protein
MAKATVIDHCIPFAGDLVAVYGAGKEEAVRFAFMVAVIRVELQLHPRLRYDSLRL